MISFRTREDSIAALLAIAAIIIMAATLGFMIFAPDPTTQGIARGRTRTERQLEQEIENAKKSNLEVGAAVDALLWSGKAEEVGPRALAAVTRLAMARNLKVVSFRPGKQTDLEGLSQLAFSLTVAGSYPNTMALIKDLENPSNKLTVSMIQVNAADAATDQVSGTVNLMAYIKQVKLVPTTNTRGSTNAQGSK